MKDANMVRQCSEIILIYGVNIVRCQQFSLCRQHVVIMKIREIFPFSKTLKFASKTLEKQNKYTSCMRKI